MTKLSEVDASNRLFPALNAQRQAFLRDGPPSLATRRGQLRKLKAAILNKQSAFVMAISSDFGHRAKQETLMLELMPVVHAIGYLNRHLARWMRPRWRGVALHFLPGRNYVQYKPLGVVGVVSPWNYPAALALLPLATALAAGNRVMLKPSELTPATSELISRLLAKVFEPEFVSVIQGDAQTGAEFTALPFDHLFFTGSPKVGRAVTQAASKNLVPVTLELGGKSPAVVLPDADLKTAARRIAYGKLANGGQTCIAPDYALVPSHLADQFAAAFAEEARRLYPAIASNPDYTSASNDRHYARLQSLVDDAAAKGAKTLPIASADKKTHARTFVPVVITNTSPDMAVMTEEIFGPILPVVGYKRIDDAIDMINGKERPLALYAFGSNSDDRRKLLDRTVAGGVTLNDTLLHYAQDALPFGGVGGSGIGAYHGFEGFKTFSHAQGRFQQARVNGTDLVRPPYGARFNRILRILLR